MQNIKDFFFNAINIPLKPFKFLMSSQSQTTKGIKDFLWIYSIVMFVFAGFAFMTGVTAFFQDTQDNPHEDWKMLLGGIVVTVLFFTGIGYMPYKAGNFLQNTSNQTLSSLGYAFGEQLLNVYFKIFALSLILLLINLFFLLVLLFCVVIGTFYSIFIILGAMLLIMATIGFILLSENFTPLEHLKEVWEILMFPSKIFELESSILKSIYINPLIIIPFCVILFIIIPNILAGFILMNREKFPQK
ncbi:MAG: hypothetical protein OHK0038_05900 [Flammeovirgaceae bacterium]